MKREYRAHPLMIVSLLKPFLFILVIPLLKGVVQYLLYRRVSGVLALEIAVFAGILSIAFLRYRCFRLILGQNVITIKSGFLFRYTAMLNSLKISSVSATQNPMDAILGAVTYRIDTEAGRIGKPDFEFKLSVHDSRLVSEELYGGESRTAIKFSLFKLAAAAATTSSAVTGLIIGVPIINKIGKMVGVALSEMLFDEINTVSESINSYFPPIINVITLIFIAGYAVSFFYSFLKNLNFKLFMGREKLEIRSGLFVRRHTLFRKDCVNDVCIEQTPLMRLVRRFSMHTAVGGYGDAKGEKAVVVPCGRHAEIRNQFSVYFPFLLPDGKVLHAARDRRTMRRFFWLPEQLAMWTLIAAGALILLFSYFDRLILFLAMVCMAVLCYYANLCLYNYKFGKIRFGENIFAQSSYGMQTREIYCEKSRIGAVKIITNPADRRLGTCKVELIVRSESADKIRVRYLNHKAVIKNVGECFQIEI